MNITELHCQPLPEGAPALSKQEAESWLIQTSGWEISAQADRLTAVFHFKNYYETMAFVNAVAWIAHQEDHHPDMTVSYNQCKISYNTHTVKGLSLNDFICAAKVNSLIKLPAQPH